MRILTLFQSERFWDRTKALAGIGVHAILPGSRHKVIRYTSLPLLYDLEKR